jgi:2'-5' RNA ligase
MKIEDELIWGEHITKPIEITIVENEDTLVGSDRKDHENKGDTTAYGCLMVFFNEDDSTEIKNWVDENIPIEFLSDFGVEDEPHVTCQYGFHEEVSIEEITAFVNQYAKDPIHLQLGSISRFSNDKHDVIKVDVDSEDLMRLSDRIRKHFKGRLDITFPTYHPHMTLAYVDGGTLPDIEGEEIFMGKTYVFKDFVYSTAGMEDRYTISKGE